MRPVPYHLQRFGEELRRILEARDPEHAYTIEWGPRKAKVEPEKSAVAPSEPVAGPGAET